ncbi:MAG: N-formylglutamate deformylase [Pseudomonadota bacterium]|nr:N-formylglutamate deformylase [Pseudomonadota bacterium]
MSDPVFTLERGSAPLLLSLPHVGTVIPDDLAPAFVPRALALEDTDWHLAEVYGFARELGASVLVPRMSRYVIDLNRPAANAPMYPGANNTELVPTRFFTGDPLYRDGRVPDEPEIERRRATYWRPYHDALAAELARLVATHGHATLWDGHSIQAELPWLFEGRLPDFNLGTAAGASCAPSLRAALSAVLAAQAGFSHVVDGRFKGGYITRHYGRPADRLHAVQLEMAFSTYMDATRAALPVAPTDRARLARLQPVLRALLQTTLAWRPDGD